MTDDVLLRLAEQAGVSPRWKDVHGAWHDVSPTTLRYVLSALGLPCDTDAAMAASLAEAERGPVTLPPLITAQAGQPITLGAAPGRFELVLEDGTTLDGMAADVGGHAVLPAVAAPGYHRLTLDGHRTVLAVAPARCFSIQDAAPGQRPWVLAVQLYALRRDGDAGLGDLGALQDLIGPAASRGAAGIAISPMHAQFSADVDRFSPYSPSSRTLLNVLHSRLDMPQDPETARLEAMDLV
ncbi:MAG: 4-alpha-glucanotransferase, partial [Gemmatimonadaceae bacterium]|nr:4-alpha-glucanotransferase [Acetobacteraceae bacterium]